MNLYFKISKGYWKKHKSRLLVLCIIYLVGTAALVTACLLIRSTKMEEIEKELYLLGDYDLIAYDVLEETSHDICSLEQVEAYGITYDMGTVAVENGIKVRAGAFADEQSETIYHLTPLRGEYPKKAGEIAIDLAYAKTCGIAPYPGESIFLDRDGKVGEYTVTGVYEITDNESYGGFLRYPNEAGEGYTLPQVYFSAEEAENTGHNRETVYCQIKSENENTLNKTAEKVKQIGNKHNDGLYNELEFQQRLALPNGRSYAYSYLLGTLGGSKNNMEGVQEAIQEGNIQADVNSRMLIPVVAALIGIVVVVSLYQVLENVLEDRMQNLGILRSIGMNRMQCFFMISLEISIAACIMVPLGLAGGNVLYQGLRLVMEQWGSGSIPNGLKADYYVRLVTLNPWLLACGVMGVSAVIVLGAFFLRIRKMTILEFLTNGKRAFSKRKGRGKRYITKSSLRILFTRVSFTTPSVFILVVIGMSVSFFGMLYAREVGRLDSAATTSLIAESNLGTYDYLATRTDTVNIHHPLIENRHDYGVPAKEMENFLKTNGIDQAEAAIVNHSGRIIWSPEAGEMPALLEKALIEPKSYVADGREDTEGLSFEEAEAEAERAIFEATGYKDVQACQTPFVGVRDTTLEQLKNYLYAGEIDVDAIRRGEEVIIAVGEDDAAAIGEAVKAGDSICLSDVVLDAKTDCADFSSEELGEYGELVYSGTITEDGAEIPIYGYCYGKRKDITVKVGAIVALPEDDFSRFYFQDENSPVNIFISTQTFEAWDLPDVNYTNIAVSLTEDAKVRSIDKGWYQMLAAGQGMDGLALGELLEKEAKEKGQMLSIFYQLDTMLVLLTLFGISLSLYSRVRKQEGTIAVLRSLGMNMWNFARVVLWQNGIILVLGAVLSFGPVLLFQMAADRAKNIMDRSLESGVLIIGASSDFIRGFRENIAYYRIFSDGCFREWLMVAALYLGIILLSMFPAYLYCQKKSIVETIQQ